MIPVAVQQDDPRVAIYDAIRRYLASVLGRGNRRRFDIEASGESQNVEAAPAVGEGKVQNVEAAPLDGSVRIEVPGGVIVEAHGGVRLGAPPTDGGVRVQITMWNRFKTFAKRVWDSSRWAKIFTLVSLRLLGGGYRRFFSMPEKATN